MAISNDQPAPNTARLDTGAVRVWMQPWRDLAGLFCL
jgi:hypothetical protein